MKKLFLLTALTFALGAAYAGNTLQADPASCCKKSCDRGGDKEKACCKKHKNDASCCKKESCDKK